MRAATGIIGLKAALQRTAALVDQVRREQEAPLLAVLLDVERLAKQNAQKNVSNRGKRHGILAGKIGHRIESSGLKASGEVGALGCPYAAFVEFGTGKGGYQGPELPKGYRPSGRRITPTSARMLRWKDPKTGADVYARSTKGAPPYPFLRPAMKTMEHKALKVAGEVLHTEIVRRGALMAG